MRKFFENKNKYKFIKIIVLFEVLLVVLQVLFCFGTKTEITLTRTNNYNTEWKVDNIDNAKNIGISNISLNSGSYSVVVYFDIEEIEKNREEYGFATPFIAVSSDDYPMGVVAENRIFSYGDKETKTSINVSFLCNSKQINIYGVELPRNYEISKIEITENYIYRITRIFMTLLLSILIDSIIYIIIKLYNKGSYSELVYLFGLGAIFLMSSLPVLKISSPTGDDYAFHISRIYEIAMSLTNGDFPVRVYQSANNGYSYASPLFYCDTFLFIPAILYILKIPLMLCYNIYVLIFNAFTIFTTNLLFKKIIEKNKLFQRWAGVALYCLSYYRIANIYTRSAVGEYTAMAFIPLVVLGLYGICYHEKVKKEEWYYLVIGATGIIQSHLLSVEIVGLIALLYLTINLKRWVLLHKILHLLGIGCVILGLNAWFIVPLLDSRDMNLVVFSRKESIQRYGLYMQNLFSIINKANGSAHGLGGPILIGTICGLIAYFLCNKCIDEKNKSLLRDALVVELICLLLSTAYFPWDFLAGPGKALEFLSAIQFPWRYLSIISLMGSVVSVIGIKTLLEQVESRNLMVSRSIVSTVIIVGVLGLEWYYSDISTYPKYVSTNYVISTDDGIRVPEYILFPEGAKGTDDSLLNYVGSNMKQYKINSSDTFNGEIIDQRRHVYDVQNTNEDNLAVELPIMNYENFRAYDEKTNLEFENITSDFGRYLMTLSIPSGYSGRIVVEYIEPMMWRVSEIVSLITLLVCVGLAFFENNMKKNVSKV